MILRYPSLIILFAMVLPGIGSAIQVSGDVWGTWSAANNPYEVVGNLHIPQCSTLVIEAGCYINFRGYYAFSVDTSATLRAYGEVADSVVFTATGINPGWGAIRFLSDCDSSELNYCIIEKGDASNLGPFGEAAGGGIYVNKSSLIIRNCSVRNNEAYEGSGGGIYIDSSEVEIIESDISHNKSSWDGAGIYCENSYLILRSCLVSCDTSRYPLGGGWGGGMSINYSEALIDNNLITNNYSDQMGGGIYINFSTAEIDHNVIIYNEAFYAGGGISVNSRTFVTISSNVIAFNEAIWYVGGGISCPSPAKIFNNTIYGNHAMGMGGGCYLSGNAIDTFQNNIAWGNEVNGDSMDEDAQIYDYDDTVLTAYYCCIQNGWPGEGNIDLDPMLVDPGAGDFHLRWDNFPIDDDTKSPCIDAGAPWSPLDPDFTRADIGAFYYDQLVGIDDIITQLPKYYSLSQNYPNPFNVSTIIKYELPLQSQATLDIYDILGRKVATLYDGPQTSGFHQVLWNAQDISSGIYLYKLQAGEYSETKKMILVK